MTTEARLHDDELLWRRIHRSHVKSDGSVSSAAFSGSDMSVDIARIQIDMSITLRDGGGVAEIRVADARSLDQDALAAPLPGNPAHAVVTGNKPRPVRRKLRDGASFTPRSEILPAT